MTQPTAYNKTTNFTAHSTASPTTPHSGVNLDAEFANIETTLDETLTNLELIQRDDGALKNQSVHADALTDAVIAIFSGSWSPQGAWATATNYAVSDVVSHNGVTYVCVEAHTSGTFSTDLGLDYWQAVSGQRMAAAPATAASAGTAGDIAYDSSYFYVCVATNTWKRAAIATW